MLFQMAMELWEEYHAGAVAEFEARAVELWFVISYQLQSEKEGFLKIHESGPKYYHSICQPWIIELAWVKILVSQQTQLLPS